MNAKRIRTLLPAVALTLAALSARPQSALTRADGRITDAGKSLPGVQIVLSHQDTFKAFRATTDKYGTFSIPDIPRGTYIVSVLTPAGDKLFRETLELTSAPDAPIRLDIEITGTPAAPPSSPQPSGAAKAPIERTSKLDSLIAQYDSARRANDSKAAIAALKAIVAADPTRWDYFEALGAMQINAEDFENAAQSLDKGIQAAQQFLSSSPSNGSPLVKSDRERATAGMAQMLLTQGNAYLKLKKNSEAIAAYTKAAEIAPDPATAYFNLCIVHYNTRTLEGAADACDKAIAANPGRADAYFIKGSLLLAAAKTQKDGKLMAPPGAVGALKKYLELAPAGPYANDVRQMLQLIGAPPDSSGNPVKKP